MRVTCLLLTLATGAFAPVALSGPGTYQTSDAFVAASFAGDPPAPRLLWLTGERGTTVTRLLGHPPPSLRVRYWERAGRSAWVLEEIGKEHPITAGFVVAGGRIEQARVLVFREARGWEIRAPAFLAQFTGRRLAADGDLDGMIDGISGATLSVAAMERMARVALYLAAETGAHGTP